jgi:hypothetical protein
MGRQGALQVPQLSPDSAEIAPSVDMLGKEAHGPFVRSPGFLFLSPLEERVATLVSVVGVLDQGFSDVHLPADRIERAVRRECGML